MTMPPKKNIMPNEPVLVYGALGSKDTLLTGEDDELRPAPFEWEAPLLGPEKVEMALACLLLLPVLRVLATLFFAGAGALWCLAVYTVFRPFGHDPRQHPPLARRVRVCLLRYPCMLIQRLWLFALGFWWIHVVGHDEVCGVWWGKPTKVIVANHTSFVEYVLCVLVFVFQQPIRLFETPSMILNTLPHAWPSHFPLRALALWFLLSAYPQHAHHGVAAQPELPRQARHFEHPAHRHRGLRE